MTKLETNASVVEGETINLVGVIWKNLIAK